MPSRDPNAIEFLVGESFGEWGNALPVDPTFYAETLGCRLKVDAIPAARLEVTSWETVIWIPADKPVRVQRSAIAHELAHLLFMVDGTRGSRAPYSEEGFRGPELRRREKVRARNAQERLEDLCDAAARTILVPRRQLRCIVQQQEEVALDFLLALADTFDVDPTVIFQRLLDIGAIRRNCLQVLLVFGPNRHTGRDCKWRVAARALPSGSPFNGFSWENEGIDRLEIHLPRPQEIESIPEIPACEFMLDKKRWALRIAKSERDASWLLAQLTRRGLVCAENLTLFPM